MKYWRGYLVAAILTAFTWAFREFARTHTKLVDMVYPYVTRMVQNFMAGWSGSLDFCLWEAILVALAAVAAASIVLMLIFRWNPIQWFGWVAAGVCLIMLLNTGIFGMNEFAGPIAEDIRLELDEANQETIQAAAVYYRDKAGELAGKVTRADGQLQVPETAQLSQQAEKGFEALVYEHYYSVFAGEPAPVKELAFADFFTSRGQMGYTVALTGEAAINPQAPGIIKPFAVCRELSYRRCIASERDKHFAAFLACDVNEDPVFQYAAAVMAYRYCLKALPQSAAGVVHAQASEALREDLQEWNAFMEPAEKLVAEKEEKDGVKDHTDLQIAKLITRWYNQEVVLPSITEPEVSFDPMDENQVDLSGLPHVPEAPEPEETEAAEED